MNRLDPRTRSLLCSLALTFALSACGEGSVTGPGGPGASPDDASVPPAVDDPVSLAFLRDGDPVAGLSVVLHDALGAPVARARTDAAGELRAGVPRGGMVTVIDTGCRAASGTWDTCLWTFVGVEPGDALRLGGAAPARTDAAQTVSLAGPVEGAVRYELTNGCQTQAVADPDAPVTLAVRESCFTGAADVEVSLLASAFDAAGVRVAHGSTPAGAAARAGASLALAPWSSSVTGFELALTNLGSPALVAARLSSVIEGVPLRVWSGFPSQDGTSRALRPADIGDAVQLDFIVETDPVAGMSSRVTRTVRRPPTWAGDAIDVAALPRVTGVSAARDSDGRPTLGWQLAGDTSELDGAAIVLDATTSVGRARWYLVAPATGPLPLPLLPPDLDAVFPAQAETSADLTVDLVGSDRWADYAALRAGVQTFHEGRALGVETQATQTWVSATAPVAW